MVDSLQAFARAALEKEATACENAGRLVRCLRGGEDGGDVGVDETCSEVKDRFGDTSVFKKKELPLDMEFVTKGEQVGPNLDPVPH